MDNVFDCVVAEFVRRSVSESTLEATAAQEHRKAFHVMIATRAAFVFLRHRRAAEFATPNDDRIVEHAPLFQVLDERRGGAVHVGGVLADEFDEVVVMVPIAVVKLDEPHAALGQAAREEAVGSERAIAGLATIEVEDGFRLVGNIHQTRNGSLHPERHLVLRDARGNLRIVHDVLLRTIQRLHGRDYIVLQAGADARRAVQIMDRIAFGTKGHALKLSGQKTAVPHARRDGLRAAAFRGSQHDKSRKILALAAEAIHDPRTHRRPAGNRCAGIHEGVRRIVIDGVGDHRADNAEIVGHRADVRKQLADFLARPTAPGKGKLRRKTSQLLILQLSNLLAFRERLGHRLPVQFGKLRFVIERLQVRRPASHIKEDDPFGAWRMVKRIHHAGPAWRGGNGAAQEARVQQAPQRHQAEAGAAEKGSAIHGERWRNPAHSMSMG